MEILSFRSPVFVKRYEDLVFELETSVNPNVANTKTQKKNGYRFVIDNSGDITALDWYNSRIELTFKVNKLADGGNLVKNEGIVNGSHSFIRKLKVEVGGITVFDTEPINHAVNLKNLLDYSTQFERDMGSNHFYFLDTNDKADEDDNIGFASRRSLLELAPNDVFTEILLNRYSFFESLDNQLLPNTRVTLEFNLETDNNLVWRKGGDDC